MIIDSHAHLYPAPDALADWDARSREEALAFQQREVYVGRRPADTAAGTTVPDAWKTLWDESLDGDWRGRRDVGFRVQNDTYAWDSDGTTYLTPARAGTSPEHLIALMDAVGVDKAVLQTWERFNHYVSRVARKYPGRFIPLARIEEPEAHTDAGIQALHQAVGELGLKGLYQNPPLGWDGYDNFHAPHFDPFWREVEALGVPVWILGSYGSAVMHLWPEVLPKVKVWQERFPRITRVQVHGFPPSLLLDGDRVRIPDLLTEIVTRHDFYVELLPKAMGYYYHPRADDIIHALYDAFGPTKLLWGSEFIKSALPHTPEHYAELKGYFTQTCPYMRSDDVALIQGGNLCRIFRIGKTQAVQGRHADSEEDRTDGKPA
jgi:hypothetical protein